MPESASVLDDTLGSSGGIGAARISLFLGAVIGDLSHRTLRLYLCCSDGLRGCTGMAESRSDPPITAPSLNRQTHCACYTKRLRKAQIPCR
jgi:hypothetical protein